MTIVDTLTLLAETSCPESYTASQYIKAGESQFVAVQVVQIPSTLGQVIEVTFGYSGLAHSALRTLGPTFEVVCSLPFVHF